jgi:membrane peptidoglycan carboxypeptidase
LGPSVYGIGEASRFYFDKKPAQLDLQEGIFLAGLLPRPKAFRYQFDSTATLKPYLADYYRVMTNFMLRKELITQQEYDAVKPTVTLKGPALEMVVPKDTAAPSVDESPTE